jgi:hypothetical protein
MANQSIDGWEREKNSHELLAGNPKDKSPLGKPKHRWEDVKGLHSTGSG